MNRLTRELFEANTGKGYRFNNGSYETFVTVDGKAYNLGTCKTEEEARQKVFEYRLGRFCSCLKALGLNEADGRVVFDRYVAFPDGTVVNLLGKRIKGSVDRCGYLEMLLDGKMRRVHRVIASAFIPTVEGKNDVNHINGIKTDNRVENLEWVTRSENVLHAYRTGLEKKRTGTKHHRHVLTKEQIADIRTNCKLNSLKGYSAAAFARKYNCHVDTIRRVLNGESYIED